MPAPKLRHYRYSPTADTTWAAVFAAVPAGRALVVSRIVVTHDSPSLPAEFYLSIGTSNEYRIASAVQLARREYYVEGGHTVLAGEYLHAFINNGGIDGLASWNVHVFGQEVDD